VNGEVRLVADVPAAFVALVAEERPASVALSGGGTAERCYEALPDAALAGATVLFGDERWVPVDDDESNEGMARRALLDRSDPAAVRSLRGAGDDREGAADAYDELVCSLPPVELVHLGLGPDGHTASLFPGMPSLEVTDRFVIATGDDAHPHPRLTFTFPGIARCHLAVVTVEGDDKADAWRRVQAGARTAPAARITAERVVWLVDRSL